MTSEPETLLDRGLAVLKVVGPATLFTATLYFWGYRFETSRARVYGLTPEFFNRSTTDYVLIGLPIAIGVLLVTVVVFAIWISLDAMVFQPSASPRSRVTVYSYRSLAISVPFVVLLHWGFAELTFAQYKLEISYLIPLALGAALLLLAASLTTLSARVLLHRPWAQAILACILAIASFAALDALFFSRVVNETLCGYEEGCPVQPGDVGVSLMAACAVVLLTAVPTVARVVRERRRPVRSDEVLSRVGTVDLRLATLVTGLVALVIGGTLWATDLSYGPLGFGQVLNADLSSRTYALIGCLALAVLHLGSLLVANVDGDLPRTLRPIARLQDNGGGSWRLLSYSLIVVIIGSAFTFIAETVGAHGSERAAREIELGLSPVSVVSLKPLALQLPGVRLQTEGSPDEGVVYEYTGLRLVHRTEDSYLLATVASDQLDLGASTFGLTEDESVRIVVGTSSEFRVPAEIRFLGTHVELRNPDGERAGDIVIGQTTANAAADSSASWDGVALTESRAQCGEESLTTLVNGQLELTFSTPESADGNDAEVFAGWSVVLAGSDDLEFVPAIEDLTKTDDAPQPDVSRANEVLEYESEAGVVAIEFVNGFPFAAYGGHVCLPDGSMLDS